MADDLSVKITLGATQEASVQRSVVGATRQIAKIGAAAKKLPKKANIRVSATQAPSVKRVVGDTVAEVGKVKGKKARVGATQDPSVNRVVTDTVATVAALRGRAGRPGGAWRGLGDVRGVGSECFPVPNPIGIGKRETVPEGPAGPTGAPHAMARYPTLGVCAMRPCSTSLRSPVVTVSVRNATRSRILTHRKRTIGILDHLHDAPLGVRRARLRFLARGLPSRRGQAKREPLAVVGELERNIFDARRGAVFDRHDDLPLAPAKVQVAVAPGMEFRRTAQPLPRARGAALACVVHEYHGGLETALELAQEREQRRHIRGGRSRCPSAGARTGRVSGGGA